MRHAHTEHHHQPSPLSHVKILRKSMRVFRDETHSLWKVASSSRGQSKDKKSEFCIMSAVETDIEIHRFHQDR
jgi:hypothetical protein